MACLHTSYLFLLALAAYSTNVFCEGDNKDDTVEAFHVQLEKVKGVVKMEKFLPKEKFTSLMSIQENLKDLDPKFVFSLKNDNNEEIGKWHCKWAILNKGGPQEIKQYRMALVTSEGAELDVFSVKSSNIFQKLLDENLNVKKTEENGVTKYVLTFKQFTNFEKHPVNYQRIYEVTPIENSVGPTFRIVKNTIEWCKGMSTKNTANELDKVTLKGNEVFITEWTKDGEYLDTSIGEKYTTGFELGCYKCYVYCKAQNQDYIVDIIVEESLLESFKVMSCDIYSLKDSIRLDKVDQCKEPTKQISLLYLTEEKKCIRGKYYYRRLHNKDSILKTMIIERQRENLDDNNEDCKKMQVDANVWYDISSNYHVGRFSNKQVEVKKFLKGETMERCSSPTNAFNKIAVLLDEKKPKL